MTLVTHVVFTKSVVALRCASCDPKRSDIVACGRMKGKTCGQKLMSIYALKIMIAKKGSSPSIDKENIFQFRFCNY